jgi:hypothetical protein
MNLLVRQNPLLTPFRAHPPITIIITHQFVFFPFLIGNIDISSVGPPPTS